MKRSITATLLSVILVLPALPQQAPPPQSPTAAVAKGVTKFSTTRQLVVVDVTAKDKNGNAIKGLKPTDFTLQEDGKKQEITVFEYQELEENVAAEPKPVPAIKKAEVKPVE